MEWPSLHGHGNTEPRVGVGQKTCGRCEGTAGGLEFFEFKAETRED
jgi:hypothetical protein